MQSATPSSVFEHPRDDLVHIARQALGLGDVLERALGELAAVGLQAAPAAEGAADAAPEAGAEAPAAEEAAAPEEEEKG